MMQAHEGAGLTLERGSVHVEANEIYEDENNAAFYKRLEAVLARDIGAGEHRRSLAQAQQPGVADSNVNPGQMGTFVLRARAAPTDSRKLLASVGQEAHTEILAHTLMTAIFVAQSHRTDVTVYLVLDRERT